MQQETDGDTATDQDDGSRLEFADTVEIAAGKDELWAYISDPENLARSIPGAEEVERVSEREYTCTISRGIRRISVSLSAELELVEMDPPDHIVAEGTAFEHTTGSDFDVVGAMRMTETDDAVELSYMADVEFTGGIATLGAHLLESVVQADVETYFENIRAAVEDGDD